MGACVIVNLTLLWIYAQEQVAGSCMAILLSGLLSTMAIKTYIATNSVGALSLLYV